MKPADWLAILRYLSLITGVGLTFIGPVLLGWWLGAWLQGQLLWQGWLYCGLVLGILAGIYSVFVMLKKIIPWE